MNPLWGLLASQPNLLAGHATAYAQLAAQETAEFSRTCERRLLMSAVALCCAMLSLGLAGVGLMLWQVSPGVQGVALWPLVAIPLLPAIGFVWCLVQLNAAKAQRSFDKLRQQLAADGVLLSDAGAP